MNSVLTRLGALCAAHPWRVIGAWALVVAIAGSLVLTVGGQPQDDYDVPGMPATVGAQFLARHFPDASGTDARVIVRAASGPVQRATSTL